MYLGDKLIIDLDGLHGDDIQQSFIAPLKKGFYPIRIEYFQKEGGRRLIFKYLPPENIIKKNPINIPFNIQYGRR
jgi:hypothetical protein